ncbi:RNase adapter RapZ [Clostridium sp. LY3-2]|uniref:RNase adapter RapZ n=1 Tax=Clostridium sp. LY3-2 TaxID=2942482 RepID=UPI0021529B42|nr:RNase adapter RapZ [Clostridium sp. LY3-2]MCR6513891.1 RNase adapter RapZ [Clostridium sp. LY3-2]
MRFVIVTGLSGAGKTEATRSLEDLGYFCVDNLPPKLIPKFAEACNNGSVEKVAIVTDIRGGVFFDDLFESLLYLKNNDFKYEILFLESSDEVLVKRFKEARISHPLAPNSRVLTGISEERNKLREVKDRADQIIDTSKYKIRDLREKINELYGSAEEPDKELSITVLSFGFKYGIPVDSDLVFDVRFIPNPFYIPELKAFSGSDEPVRKYVLEQKETEGFLEKLMDMLRFLIPNYTQEGKRQLIVSIGCTGGRHRSVAIANELYDLLSKEGYKTGIEHRDISEDVNRGAKKL